MKKEWIKIEKKETAIKVRNTKVEALRQKNIVKKGFRVFENGYIGISGCIGDTSDEILENQAMDNLSVKIEYPYEIEKNRKDHRKYSSNPMTSQQLLENTENILEVLRNEYPEFDFSETVSIQETTVIHQNTEGLDLKYEDANYSIELLLKDKKSANLMDGFIINQGRKMDIDKFWESTHPLLKAYSTDIEMPDLEKMPVLFLGLDTFADFLNRCLNGESYATGSSIFSGKIGEKLFNENINITQCRDSKETLSSFFDSEGVVQENDNYSLIENGVLKNVFTNKRVASKFALPNTGAASGEYDGMPNLSQTNLSLKVDNDDLKKALGNKPAIFVMLSAGGDFTPDGDYASPVQVSFLYDGEKLVGKLPELNIRSNIFKMLGEDYIGTFDNKYFYIGDIPMSLIACNMNISL